MRTLERIVVLQCGPWGGRPAWLRPNSGRADGGAGRGRAGEGLGVARLRFEGLDRAEVAPASGVPAARECGRRGCYSDEAAANARYPAVVAALGDASGGVGTVAWLRELAGTRLDGGGHGAAAAEQGTAAGAFCEETSRA
jgi:hypothetical protein